MLVLLRMNFDHKFTRISVNKVHKYKSFIIPTKASTQFQLIENSSHAQISMTSPKKRKKGKSFLSEQKKSSRKHFIYYSFKYFIIFFLKIQEWKRRKSLHTLFVVAIKNGLFIASNNFHTISTFSCLETHTYDSFYLGQIVSLSCHQLFC